MFYCLSTCQVLPLARIKRIIKSEGAVKAVSSEASFAVARAAVSSVVSSRTSVPNRLILVMYDKTHAVCRSYCWKSWLAEPTYRCSLSTEALCSTKMLVSQDLDSLTSLDFDLTVSNNSSVSLQPLLYMIGRLCCSCQVWRQQLQGLRELHTCL